MVELQSCATLVNASALRDIQQEVQGDGVNAFAEISAELERERQRNAELMERISILEAQIQERDRDCLLTHGHGNFSDAMEGIFKKFKKQRIEPGSDTTDEGSIIRSVEMAYQLNHDTQCLPPKDTNPEDRIVNWMSMDEAQFLNFEKSKDGDSAADCDDTDDSDDEDDDYYEQDDVDTDHKYADAEYDNIAKASNEPKKSHCEGGIEEGIHISCLGSSYCGQEEPPFGAVSGGTNEDRKKDYFYRKEQRKGDRKETKRVGGYHNTSSKAFTLEQEICHKLSGSIPLHKKPPKLAFCPKEVKRIMESGALTLKNAQSHTIRKIIVFASLGIRHGCEDMYELDFNHFTILRKDEPYVSPKNPGEHVLYENPGVRRKVFYPNRQNPVLCPVRILEEEKEMRPPDASCPSCLFLCIKYGGRTRNLPQNEYVRQRMGRNKLKSFGPVMCQMAMLVHIRSGSFFFKALGITLLFMAGFPDDMVQRETKYRNLDLLQKYYRTDEDAQAEELFLSQPVVSDTQVSPDSQQLTSKMNPAKSKGKKQANSTSKPQNLQKPSTLPPAPSTSAPVTQFGLMGYTSIRTRAIASFQSMTSHTPVDTPHTSNPVVTSSGPDVFHNQTPYPMFPPQPANAFMPMLYWPPPNTFPPCPYPASYGYQSFPSTGNYMSIHPQPYYSQPSCGPFIPKMVEDSRKNDIASEEADSDPDSNSSAEPKEILASCK